MPTIKILQTYFKDEQKDKLDSAFTPFNVSDNPAHHLREFPLYYSLFEENKHRENDYTGVVSYKFNLKSKTTGNKFLSFIQENPGYDVYFINPYPQLSYLAYNIWEQGEYFHPGIKDLTDHLLESSSINIKISTHGRDTRNHLLYANYWVGNELFWDLYISFLLELHDLTSVSTSDNVNPYLDETPYMTPTAMYPFIFERLFTTFIKNETSIKYLAYNHTHDEIRKCCNSPAELSIYDNIHKIVDRWDVEDNYDDERKAIFMSLLSSAAEYEKLLIEIGKHPFG